MKRSNRLLILLGLIIAVGASLLAAAYVSSAGGGGGGGGEGGGGELASPTPTPEPRVTVVAAAVAIPAGTTIKAEMLKTKDMTLSDRNALGADTFSRKEDVVGKIAGSNIAADQVLVASKDFYAPGAVMEGKSLKDSISAGMVGISMEVDQVSGVGTLIVPGDHVDIILTVYVDQLSISVKNTDIGVTIPLGGQQLTSKLIFENCRVLATLLPPVEENAKPTPVPAPGATGPAVSAQPSTPVVQNTGRHMIVIIEVWPDQATVIRWAQRAEKADPQNYIDLALVLRSSKDDGADIGTKSKVGGVTFAVLVAEYGVLPPDPTKTLPKALGDKIRW